LPLKNKGDNCSDDKGGEPKVIDGGEIAERTYAFIATSEGMDCTNVNRAGDLGPESIKLVSAID
jgi:hypothetical protein